LRLLQGEDRDQQELDSLREALRHGEATRALLRNQRKDGAVFVNDMQIYPLRDGEGKVTHFIGYHREGGTRAKTGDTGIRGLPSWVREDRLTGLASRYYFEDVLKRDFALAQRDKTEIALLLFDIDQLGPYNEVFERTGGDAVVKRVARAIAASFRRGTDIVGRWEGASVIALMHGTQADHVIQHATTIAHRVREQQIHHPRSTQRYVTVSGGVAIHTARGEDSAEKFLKAVEAAVARAKEQGRNRVIVAEEADFR
jgi:diguanylate cyclase (GGDEF)-like protein